MGIGASSMGRSAQTTLAGQWRNSAGSGMGFFNRLWAFFRDGPFQLRGPDYHHFRRIIIPTLRGTTEIDHLIVSKFGIFVVELKDRSGWIFGNAADAHWSAVHFKKKFRFQNPLRQNYGHMKALEAFLGVDPRVLHGIVVFRGSLLPLTLSSGRSNRTRCMAGLLASGMPNPFEPVTRATRRVRSAMENCGS